MGNRREKALKEVPHSSPGSNAEEQKWARSAPHLLILARVGNLSWMLNQFLRSLLCLTKRALCRISLLMELVYFWCTIDFRSRKFKPAIYFLFEFSRPSILSEVGHLSCYANTNQTSQINIRLCQSSMEGGEEIWRLFFTSSAPEDQKGVEMRERGASLMKFAPRSHLEREGGAIIAGLLFVRCEEGLGRDEGAGGAITAGRPPIFTFGNTGCHLTLLNNIHQKQSFLTLNKVTKYSPRERFSMVCNFVNMLLDTRG